MKIKKGLSRTAQRGDAFYNLNAILSPFALK